MGLSPPASPGRPSGIQISLQLFRAGLRREEAQEKAPTCSREVPRGPEMGEAKRSRVASRRNHEGPETKLHRAILGCSAFLCFFPGLAEFRTGEPRRLQSRVSGTVLFSRAVSPSAPPVPGAAPEKHKTCRRRPQDSPTRRRDSQKSAGAPTNPKEAAVTPLQSSLAACDASSLG